MDCAAGGGAGRRRRRVEDSQKHGGAGNAEPEDGGDADRPTPVQTTVVQQKTMPIYLTALGTVTAYNTVTIKSRVDGQLIPCECS